MTLDENQLALGDLVKWEPKYEIGIPVVDGQHKKLFKLCNNLHVALCDQTLGLEWEKEFVYTLKQCVEYVKVHFKSEEILMRAAGFAGYEEHKKVHDAFIQKVLEFSHEGNYSIGTAFRLLHFLYEWILSHIAHDDKLFVRSVLEYNRRRQADKDGASIENLSVLH